MRGIEWYISSLIGGIYFINSPRLRLTLGNIVNECAETRTC
jgi:hypothetical protein